MATYLSLPVFQTLIELVDKEAESENEVKSLANGMLSYYFPVIKSWIIVPQPMQNDSSADSLVLRVHQRCPTTHNAIHYAVALTKKKSGDSDTAADQIQVALRQSTTESGRCWAIVFHGPEILFYEYHANLPENHQLCPTGPPSQSQKNKFHLQTDSLAIHEMFMHMREQKTPHPR